MDGNAATGEEMQKVKRKKKSKKEKKKEKKRRKERKKKPNRKVEREREREKLFITCIAPVAKDPAGNEALII